MAEVKLEVEEQVATLTLAAPERRNALTPSMARELAAKCEEIDDDPSIGAVIVAGEGQSFCAGADRATLRASGADRGDETVGDVRAIYDSFVRVGRLAPPSIAAVRGAAVGAGLNLALATDLRVVSLNARLIGGFQQIGIHPGGGNASLLGRTGGRETAMAVAVFGEEVSGPRAVEVGLAWVAVPEDEVEARAKQIAAGVARDPELARTIARSARTELGPPGVAWDIALELEAGPQLWSLRRAFGPGGRSTAS